jgi:hypothetical protein
MQTGSPWENPTTIDIGAFILSVFIANFAVFLLYHLSIVKKEKVN